MSIISLIIKREFIAKVRNKSFIVMTFLSPLLFVGIAVFVSYLSNLKAEVKTIAIHDETGLFVNEFKNTAEFKYQNLSVVDMKLLRQELIKENYSGIIYVPISTKNNWKNIQFIANESPSSSFLEKTEATISNRITKINLEKSKLDTLAIQKAQANIAISVAKPSGEASLKGLNEIKIAIGGAFGYLIMMFIVIYGNMVMRSVIEEKTNRIIEIIISSVKPFQLMIGKIIGTSLAGVMQFIIWAVLGVTFIIAANTFLGINASPTNRIPPEMMQGVEQQYSTSALLYLKEIMSLPIGTILVCFVIYFIGGFFLYSSFYASIGAAVDSETDSQQFLLPIIMPLILGVYIGFFTVMNDPHGTIATVFSIIPLTSPIVMLMRIPFGVPWWQLVLSIALLFSTFLLVVLFASKIYRVGILMYGKKPTWKELYKWIKM